MRRFYCTVCKKVKRVQKWPATITNIEDTMPENRVGICNRHNRGIWRESNPAQVESRFIRTKAVK